MQAAGLVLTVPALLLLGLSSSPHCALMCGPLNLMAGSRPARVLQLHAGRLLAYAGLGALAGGSGGLLLHAIQRDGAATALRIAFALVLLAIAALRWQAAAPKPACCLPSARRWLPPAASLPPLLRGFAWGLVPCGLLYGVLLLASLTASPLQGALLAAAFGFGTLPLLLLLNGLWRRRPRRTDAAGARHAGAALLAVSGLWVAMGSLLPVAQFGQWCASLVH